MNDEFAEELAERRKAFIGTFETHVPCNCRPGQIIKDFASEENSAVGSADPFDLLNGFKVKHEYGCEACGKACLARTVEGVLGYKPLERRNSTQI